MKYRVFQRSILFPACWGVHTVAEEMLDDLRDFGLKHRNLMALPNGVDCDRFAPTDEKVTARQKVGLPADALVIGNVGRMFPHKRQTLLIEAFDLLAGKEPRLQLLIVGDSRLGKDSVMDRISRSPFRERIHACGFQTDPIPWYRAMDLLAVPSLYEGMSNVVLEAMATGLPVVAHSACGMAEMIEDGRTGRIGDIRTAEDLAVLIQKLVDPNGSREAMGTEARKRAETVFSMEQMMDRYRKTYISCVGRSVSG